MTRQNIFVIGGGLAGMIAAKELAQQGKDRFHITILESGNRLGGKAGADLVGENHVEHGYHVFPGWYANTRALLKELDILSALADIREMHYVSKDGDYVTVKDLPFSAEGIGNLWHDLFHGPISWREMLLLFYLMFDLANQPWRYKSFLDQTTANAFLASRLVATEKIAELQHLIALQGVSIPSYEVSAMTLQKVVRAWSRYGSPLFSILKGDLQRQFIEPFESLLHRNNVEILKAHHVVRLRVEGGEISTLELANGKLIGSRDDVFLLATPPEVTVRFVDPEFFAAEDRGDTKHKALADLSNLRTAPMSAIYLTLKHPVTLKNGEKLPREHVVLEDSKYLTSFIDLSPFWGLEKPVLSIIASNMAPLLEFCDIPETTPSIKPIDVPAAKFIIAELAGYLNGLDENNIDKENSYARLNLNEQLFLNAVGAWQFRPHSKTRLPNLYVAGDYCRTEADLTTMESAIISGRQTANAILTQFGLPSCEVLSLKTASGWNPGMYYPRLLLRLIQWPLYPFILVLYYSLLPSGESGQDFFAFIRELFR